MADQARVKYPVAKVGHLAQRFLSVSRRGVVDAVFDRSIYIRTGNSCICLGGSSLGRGPLNVIAGICEETWRKLEFTRGMPVWISSGSIRIGEYLHFDLNGAALWGPPAPQAACLEKVEQGLHALEMTARNMVPGEGLGQCIFSEKGAGPEQDPVLRRAHSPLESLGRWLQMALCDTHGYACRDEGAERWKSLVGLGPGLTPSGDDLLGGAMIALCGLGEMETAERLFASIKADLCLRTNSISAAHLEAAVEGVGNEHLHRVLNAVVSGACSGYRTLLKGVGCIGHTSGWDALAGMVIVCRAWIMAVKQNRPETAPFRKTAIHI